MMTKCNTAATVCCLCGEKFNWEDKNFRKVRNHCHYAGKYCRTAYLSSNLEYKEHIYIRVLAHNLDA